MINITNQNALRNYTKKKLLFWSGYLFKIFLGLIIILPIIVCVSYSFKTNEELMGTAGLYFLPENPTLENFIWVIDTIPIALYMVNTLIQCGIVIIAQLVICSLAAYAFVFFNFPLKKVLFSIVLASMMIPGDVVIITNYIQIQQWNLTDTHLGLAFPYLVGGLGIFLMRQFYLTLPRDLKDAAEIDGCTDMGFFFIVAVPLSIPSLASLAIYQFIAIYNRYFWPLIVTNKASMRTIQIGMAMLEGGESGKTPYILAGASLCILPAVLVFIFGQRYLIKGMTAGALKG